jgi:natural product biosynthesis luciferase-like monooxygenase protein
MQMGMLFHHIAADQPGSDFEQVVCELREEVDSGALESAWRQVIAANDVLRTRFRWREVDEPEQEVLDAVDAPFQWLDWSDGPNAEQEKRFAAFLADDRARGFDLGEAPLSRFAVIRLGPADFRFVWSFPHILLDGGSFTLLTDEAFRLYDAIRAGNEAIPTQRRPYREFIAWLGEQSMEGAEDFWRTRLRDVAGPTRLPADREARGAGPTRGRQTFCLSEETTSALRALAREGGFTLNNAVQGAWGLVLSRQTGERRVVFGGVRAGRRFGLDGADSMAGLFINTLPVVVEVEPEMPVQAWLKALSDQQYAARPYEHTPLVDIARWSSAPAGADLFESILIFDNESLDTALHRDGRNADRRFLYHEQTTFPLTLNACVENGLLLQLTHDRSRFSDETAGRLLDQLRATLEGIAAAPQQRVGDLGTLPEAELSCMLVEWNQTEKPFPNQLCVHELIEAQAEVTPDATALVFRDRSLTYHELNSRANRLAHALRGLGVGPEVLVGICAGRSLEMVVGVLAVLKAGGGYVPLDPEFPRDRLAFMIEDSQVRVLLCQKQLVASLPEHDAMLLVLDSGVISGPDDNPGFGVTPENVAYVLYTSGSTGKPKGVVVRHRNVVNFFAGMDDHLEHDAPGAWLAVTTLSFDISVLELLWPLCHGFKVVIHDRSDLAPFDEPEQRRKVPQFSLFYFASDESRADGDKYRLLTEGARFADHNGFAAVWIPERHFHAFGGLFPNPSVAAAAVAMITERVAIRAGSVVLPLHSPLRVAEEWAMVDNLSGGRAGMSVASGWQPNDFVLKPENFSHAKAVMTRDIETIQRLWRGEKVSMPGHDEQPVEVGILPRPVQQELPLWLTAAGSPETFQLAGRLGASILTHLLGQSLDELREKLRIYRSAWKAAGHAGEGHVTLMLHTFVGEDDAAVRETVREPMIGYLGSSMSLIKDVAWSFPTFQQRTGAVSRDDDSLNRLSPDDTRALLDHAFERYYQTSGLFGTPETCLAIVDRLVDVGVDEIACLIDFGVETEEALAGLERLKELKEACEAKAKGPADYSIPALIAGRGVTHLQCTPSMATMLVSDPAAREALGSLHQLLIGGEAFPPALARDLKSLVPGDVINVYGPTETTIWSTLHVVETPAEPIPIGRPLANQRVYILDEAMRPAPIGAAGELYIAGSGVARGYLRREDLTAERFVEDPFSDEPDARMYRTGDLARWLPSGVIEFLGRADFQVKLRGHRIELGEIEALLHEHPAVSEAVVVAREDTPGDVRLVAYVVASGGASLEPALRSRLQESLPEYMVPAHSVFLDALPRTPNGKTDRKALPQPDVLGTPDGHAALPESELEELIAGIWKDVLKVPSPSVTTNFFDLGGHSLLAVQVHRRLVEQVAPGLKLTDLFRFPTIRALADFLGSMGEEEDASAQRGLDRASQRREAAALRFDRRAARRV